MAKATGKTVSDPFAALQAAVAQADADQDALRDAQKAANDKVTAAKDAYDAVVAEATASVKAAADKAGQSSAVVLELQGEMNHLLGRFDSRVRVG